MTRGSIVAVPPGPFTSRDDGAIRVSPSQKSLRPASSAATDPVDALPCKSLTPKKIGKSSGLQRHSIIHQTAVVLKVFPLSSGDQTHGD